MGRAIVLSTPFHLSRRIYSIFQHFHSRSNSWCREMVSNVHTFFPSTKDSVDRYRKTHLVKWTNDIKAQFSTSPSPLFASTTFKDFCHLSTRQELSRGQTPREGLPNVQHVLHHYRFRENLPTEILGTSSCTQQLLTQGTDHQTTNLQSRFPSQICDNHSHP